MKKTVEFTEEELLEYVRGFLLADAQAYTVGDIKDALHNAQRLLLDDQDGIEALGTRLGWERSKTPLATFLPRQPTIVPPLKDGWVFVGACLKGKDPLPRGKYIAATARDIMVPWDYTPNWIGDSGNLLYAIRRDAPSDIWHRLNLLSPEEGGGWYPHTPGAQLPDCAPQRLDYFHPYGGIELSRAKVVINDCVGWRPALEDRNEPRS